jgi:uncharacterized lipoprotein YddW (UPF0748 family)
VRALYERVHARKPWLKVGISPFALPRRERRPAGIEGFDPHAKLYADAELWLAQGWLDYVAPQLYWPMAQRAQAFDVLLAHWAATNTPRRHLWPGLFTSRVALPPNPWSADEIERQLAHLRALPQQAGGHIHFSMVALLDDRGGLASKLLAAPLPSALVPASPWLDAAVPPPPLVDEQPGWVAVRADDGRQRWLVLWQRRGGHWRMTHHARQEAIAVPRLDAQGRRLQGLVASSLSRTGVESERVSLRVMDHD